MAVRKVIEDSDDEGHDDNNSPSRPSVDGSSMSSMKKFTDVHLSSSSSKSPQVHDESSTGSTERLNRDIREAHNKLLEQTPESGGLKVKLMRSSQQPPTSPEMPHLKSRRATTAFSERKEKKPLKTYGSKASQDTEFYSSSNLAFEYSPRRVLECVNSNKLSQEIDAHGIVEEAQSKIQGCEIASSIHIDCEGSEYVGNTNEPQLARALISPISPLQTSANIGTTQGSQCSIMPLFIEAQDTVQFETAPVVTCDDPDTRSSFDRMPSLPLSERSSDEVNDSTNLGGERKKSRKRTLSQTDPPPLELEEKTKQPDQLPQHRAKRVRIEEAMAPPTSSGENPEDANDELSLSVLIPLPSATKPKPSKSRKAESIETIPGDELGLDEISSGLLTEHYQPRPSRSRSGLVDDKLLVPVDFSKRPESIAKRKRKNRRKTTAFEHLIYNDEEAEEKISEPQTPPQTTLPPPDQDQDQAQPQSQLQNQEPTARLTAALPPKTSQPPTTTVPTAPSPKKRGRPKKQPPAPLPPPPPPILSPTKPNHLSPSPHPSPSPSPSPPKPKTPQKPPALKGPDKHSPLSSGKVAYRVGLSRKARIEPLLRVRRR